MFCAHKQEAARRVSALLPGLQVKTGNIIPIMLQKTKTNFSTTMS